MPSALAYYAPRAILTLFAGITAIVPYIADFNHTHVYNPTWPGHARFHNGQTMSMGTYLGLSTLWLTWRPAAKTDNLLTATVVAAAYYTTMFTAYFFPGATAWDPPQQAPFEMSHLAVVVPMLSLVGTAYALEQLRVGGLAKSEKAKSL
ncbi:hypothetical protein LTR85_008029 [Meristemomyces frigidus]|nr:hypothetical protein LTR85_008029 [Meristemomyces frigidus]